MVAVAGWLLVMGAGLAALLGAVLGTGPAYLPGAGAVLVATGYAWALAARTGGRPWVFGALAAVLGVGVVWADSDLLRTGAAVLTCVAAGVLGVMATVPASRGLVAAREVLVATALAAPAALATVGFEPVVSPVRFEYVALGLALAVSLVLVLRLGAGRHGLGRRGVGVVLLCGLALGGTLVYGELLRRYGAPELLGSAEELARAARERLGAVPRPLMTLLGVPALAWGCHLRASSRQGWWVCSFGVAATVPVAHALIRPGVTFEQAGLAVLYSLVAGLLLGYAVIRVDRLLTGGHGRRARGSGPRAVVAEPRRTEPLL